MTTLLLQAVDVRAIRRLRDRSINSLIMANKDR